MPNVESSQQSATHTFEQTFQQAVIHHQAGRLTEAEELYRSILQHDPNHPEANHNMGVLALHMKQPVAGLSYFIAALEANPAHGQYWLSYIDALFQAGQPDAAREVLALARQQGLQGSEINVLAACLKENVKHEAARQIKPAKKSTQHKGKAPDASEINAIVALFTEGRYAEAATLAQRMTVRFPSAGFGWKALGTVLMQTGKNDEALVPMQKAAALSPDDAYAYSNLGNLYSSLNRPDEAEASLRRALAIDADFAEAHCNLGSTLQELGRLTEAEVSYQRALEIRPDLAEAHYNLGNCLKESGRLNEAEDSYRRALGIKPDYVQVYSNLGIMLNGIGRPDEAEASLRLALQLKPDYVQAHSNLGNILQDMGRLAEAEASYRRALEIRPDLAETYNNLGNVLQDMGRLDMSEASYRQALQLKPGYFKAHSNLLFSLNHSASNAPSYGFAEAQLYGRKLSQQVASRFTEWSCTLHPERLRIGFVSGDFKNHPVGYFLENLLNHLDSAAVELIAYPTDSHVDEFTARIKSLFSAWKPLSGLSDETAARLIHSDSVHVLIDLSGHTRYNRLPVFAWKPAPVQVSWLGYFATTGVAEMDYLIADPWTLPESEEIHFTERIWRLPETRLCFTPPDIELDISPLPALTNGCITFGCFNNLTKMNDEVIALWSRVLVSVPGSRLFLKAKQLTELKVREHTVERFAEHGVDADRLILEGPGSREKYLATYHQVDIALDPFPYTGGTTSVESLWMGVPVLTLTGASFLSRQGVGILMNAGLPEWVATGKDDYVRRAALLTGDLQRLSALRNGLRQRLQMSPIMDARRFAIHFESAVRSMWEAWRHQP
ncbi:tetratricopeptide repeat protein [Sulfuriferula sp. AH1]|uniref:tetratricopeptide repeat protein n=1 Tax=Sulfuriferula sp. AH1 TaxID=1985873 RepID=UPI001CB8A713|nr:tetratricopeptide repeat protein [Sulfuriferula sp. AH1]